MRGLILGAGLVLSVAACTRIAPQPPDAGQVPATAPGGQSTLEGVLAKGQPALLQQIAESVTTDPYVYLEAHIAWSDQRCHTFFNALQRSFMEKRLATDEIGLASGTGTAAAALAGASTNVLAGIGIGTTFLQQSITNVAQANFLEPEPSVVYQLVRKEHEKFLIANRTSLEGIAAADAGNKRSVALAAVAAQSITYQYARLCTRENIARVITEAITSSDVEIESPDQTEDLAINLLEVIAERSLTPTQAAWIYWIITERGGEISDKAEEDQVMREIGSDLVSLAKTKLPELQNLFLSDLFNSTLRARAKLLGASLTSTPPPPAGDEGNTPAALAPSRIPTVANEADLQFFNEANPGLSRSPIPLTTSGSSTVTAPIADIQPLTTPQRRPPPLLSVRPTILRIK